MRHQLAAYRLTSLVPETILHPGDFLLGRIHIVNTGGGMAGSGTVGEGRGTLAMALVRRRA